MSKYPTNPVPAPDSVAASDSAPAGDSAALGHSSSAGTASTDLPSTPARTKPVSVRTLQQMRRKGNPISMLTAYDFPTAQILDRAGVDVILVGDSLAMVFGGHDNTLPVTLDQMIYHGEIVARAAEKALVVVDMPFPEGQLSIDRTLESAARIMKETGAGAVKLEGGSDHAGRVSALVQAGIPVMGHIGLRPQSVHVTGGYRVQRDKERLVKDAIDIENAGAFAIVVECVPESIGKSITEAISIPTIGIGAGAETSGQVLVTHDLIGFGDIHVPKFVRVLGNANEVIAKSVNEYIQEVQARTFPNADESFGDR